ncbi:MAG TPA: hypothetical protein VHM69_07520 [Rubrobacter sp.]|nr:hypothetical protein [Rubrobacter sp.]
MRPARSKVARLPVKRGLTLPRRLSLVVAVLTAAASTAGLVLGPAGLYGTDPKRALGVTEGEAGLLLPGFLGQDVFNLVVALPLLLGTMWLAQRGSLAGLLLWPGALFYVLYWYVLYLIGAPFSVLFLLYVPLVTLSACAIIALVSSIDDEEVRRRLAGAVPARIIGGILVALALLTIAQDGSGAFVTALGENAPIDPVARHVWIADLALQAPAVLAGGVLLWRREALGYVAGAGLLLQYGLSVVGFVASMALRAVLTASSLDMVALVILLVFGVICFVPLASFVRAAMIGDANSRSAVVVGASNEPVEPVVKGAEAADLAVQSQPHRELE